jgi:hypothetical protein
LICSVNVYAQTKTEFFPGDLTIRPFTANTIEPKLGFLFQLNKNELRLDIGNSFDIVRWEYDNKANLSFGADLFTYTSLRKTENFHFPVDAVDYLFGLNMGYRIPIDKYEFGLRFRLSHISAHMVDGRYNKESKDWINGENPIVYSREFLELMPYFKLNTARIYIGMTYIYHVDPSSIKKDNYQIGFDYYLPLEFLELLSVYVAYDLKLIHLEKYTANNSVEVGFKFGYVNGTGIRVYLNYYSGKSLHGEFYYKNVRYSALGINLDL